MSSNSRSNRGATSLATFCPEAAAEWHPDKNGDLTPADVARSSGVKRWWLCKEHGHEWYASPNGRIVVKDGTTTLRGCPYCSGRLLLPGFNDMATKAPQLAAEWHPIKNNNLTPADVFPASQTKRWWRCAVHPEHEWFAAPNTRLSQQQGCPVCAGKRTLAGFNDLASAHPALMQQWSPRNSLDPATVAPASHMEALWICPADPQHEYSMQISKRTGRGFGCPYCVGRRVLPGVNDLATLRPAKAARWDAARNFSEHGVLVSEVSPGSDLRAYWKCDRVTEQGTPCGGSWRAHVYSDAKCPVCERYGSAAESELADLVTALLPPGTQIERGVRDVPGMHGLELDIWVPSLSVAIEHNGVFWHSERLGYDRARHARKHRLAREAGIGLVTVWGDDFLDRREIVLRTVAHRLGVVSRLGSVLDAERAARCSERLSARALLLDEAARPETEGFLLRNHVQGGSHGLRSFVLRDDAGAVRALLGIRRGGRTRLGSGEWEVRRYATEGLVRGGLTRLLSFAERQLRAEGVAFSGWVSFAAHDVSDGSAYLAAGFVADPRGEVVPSYWYAGSSTGWRRESKERYTKRAFRDREDLLWREGFGERELAALNGLTRVWDSGKTRFVRR